MAHEYQDALIINRLNGGRLSVRGGSLADGAQAIVVRYSTYDKSYPQRWNTVKVGEDDHGNDIVRIEKSNESGTFCMDVGSDSPEAAANSYVRVKEADGSDRQKWRIWEDVAVEGSLVKLVSHVDTTVEMCVQDYGGDWDLVVLNRQLSSVDRLWYFNDIFDDIIPN